MVEFRFDIKPLFPQPVIRVTSNLLPHTFRGDRRQALDTSSKISEIIDRLGELSAVSQKLTKPVTTAQRLRMSENQTIYLLADVDNGHNGSVLGLLKVGKKDLYLFDETGETKKVLDVPCILDFYIHESRQRAGLGKTLFQTMLMEEKWTPVKCSVDRPSDKLLGFLKKHFGLVRTIPQANNFVLYEGFFDLESEKGASNQQTNGGTHVAKSPNALLFGVTCLTEEGHRRRSRQLDASTIGAQLTQISPVGRYGARRPICSMAEGLQDVDEDYFKRNIFSKPSNTKHSIIQSSSGGKNGDAKSNSVSAPTNTIEAITEDLQGLKTGVDEEAQPQSDSTEVYELASNAPIELAGDTMSSTTEHVIEEVKEDFISATDRYARSKTPSIVGSESILSVKKPTTFQLSKQHTGMKNISFGVGMAVTPTNKMEFDQESREDFGVVKINRPVAKLASPSPQQDNTDAMSTVSSAEGMTDQGYYDLKFYHNKLW